MPQFKITKGRHTARHGETLRKLGFSVTETPEAFIIEATGLILPDGGEEALDLSTPENAKTVLKVCVEEKKLLSYKTKMVFEDTQKLGAGPLWGLPAISRLEKLAPGASALMAKPVKPVSPASQGIDLFNL